MKNVNKSLAVYTVVSYKLFVSLRQLYVYQVDFDAIIPGHTQKMEMEDTSNSTSFMKSMIIRKGFVITIKDYRGFAKPAYETFRLLMHRVKLGFPLSI